MNWLKWLFCPHDWSNKIREDEAYWNAEDAMPMYTEYLYQCSKCTRFKKVRV